MASSQPAPPSLEQMIENASIFQEKENQGQPVGVNMPESMAKKRDMTADDVFKEMNRHPLFMTSFPDPDDKEANEYLDAIKALAYEGTRAEIAENFKNQGNEAVAEKRWVDAREFYSKALAALKGPKVPVQESEADPEHRIVEIDEEAEVERERKLEETCAANRARVQLEMKNYGSCNRDCATALKLNPRNVKAWYRAATACLALDKLPEALDAADSGLRYDQKNSSLQAIKTKIEKRQEYVNEVVRKRTEREERERAEATALKHALKTRNILIRDTASPPNLEDAVMALSEPTKPESTLSFPVIFLYPLEAESDFIKSVSEHESLGDHLSYVLPPPWDQKGEYAPDATECYVETASGGLMKAGKKLSLLKLLGSGKIEVVDGLMSVNVVPKAKAQSWIETWKIRNRKT